MANLVAYVWWCGDDYCDCTQARIERKTPHPTDGRYVRTETIWSGTFRTDSMPGATRELNRTAQYLRRHCHDLYVQIEWPWDRPD